MAKRNDVLNDALHLNRSNSKYVVEVRGNQIIFSWKWMDGTYVAPDGVRKELQEYSYIITVFNDGTYAAMDATRSQIGSFSLKGIRTNNTEFYGRSIQFNKTLTVGVNNDTGEIGVNKYEFNTGEIHQVAKQFMEAHGFRRVNIENYMPIPKNNLFIKIICLFAVICLMFSVIIFAVMSDRPGMERALFSLIPIAVGGISILTLAAQKYFKIPHSAAIIAWLYTFVGLFFTAVLILIASDEKRIENAFQEGLAQYKTGTVVELAVKKTSDGYEPYAIYEIFDDNGEFIAEERGSIGSYAMNNNKIIKSSVNIGDTKEYVVIYDESGSVQEVTTYDPAPAIVKIIMAFPLLFAICSNIYFSRKRNRVWRELQLA